MTTEKETKKKGKFFAGVRWGLGTPTVMVIALAPDEAVTGPKLIALHEYYADDVMLETVIEEAKDIDDHYPVARWFCMATEPRYIREFRKAQLRAVSTKFEEAPGINLVRGMLARTKPGEPGQPPIPDPALLIMPGTCPNLAVEFQRFSNKKRDPNKPFVDKPIQAHNFALTALTLIALGLGFRPTLEVRFL